MSKRPPEDDDGDGDACKRTKNFDEFGRTRKWQLLKKGIIHSSDDDSADDETESRSSHEPINRDTDDNRQKSASSEGSEDDMEISQNSGSQEVDPTTSRLEDVVSPTEGQSESPLAGDESGTESESGSVVESTVSDTTDGSGNMSDQEDEPEDMSDEEDELQQIDDSTALYEGSPVSVAESLSAILTFSMAHNLPGSCLAGLLDLISLHCIQPNKCTTTLYKFKKYFAKLKTALICHYFCSACVQVLPSKDGACNCESPAVRYFIEMPFLEQLKELYARDGFFNDLQYRFSREKIKEDNIEDIYDADLYKAHVIENGILSDKRNISLMWYTDGAPVFKSTKYSIWPFFLVINELSYAKRTAKENVMLAGLWFGPTEPIANLFLKPLQEHFQRLYKGIDFVVPNFENPVHVKGILLCGTCDLPARSTFLNTMRFNGAYGCPRCKQKGENVPTGTGSTVHVYPYEKNIVLRDNEEHEVFASEALRTGKPIYGVKGPSVLYNFTPNLIFSTSVDVMHAVYLGVVKKLLMLWFDSSYHSFPFSLSKLVGIVDQRLLKIKPPEIVNRMPRGIQEHSHYWKASELKAWMFYYSVPVLSGVMTDQYLDHYMMLVQAIYLLNQDSISNEMLQLASSLITKFVQKYEELYGVRFMTVNVHQLLHLPRVVQDLGPLWVTSCFPFEDLNGKLLNMVHGTRHVQLQILSSVSLFRNLDDVIKDLPQRYARAFCSRMIHATKKLKVIDKISENCFSVGKYTKLTTIPFALMTILLDQNVQGRNIKLFYKLKMGNVLFFSKSYPRNLKTTSYFVQYLVTGIEAVGIIEYFIKVTDCECLNECTCSSDYYAIVRKTELHEDFLTQSPPSVLTFMKRCNPIDDVVAVKVNDLINVCYCIDVENTIFVAKPVNKIELE